MRFTRSAYDCRVEVEIPDDSDIYEAFEAFRGFLIACTYHPESVDRVICELPEHFGIKEDEPSPE